MWGSWTKKRSKIVILRAFHKGVSITANVGWETELGVVPFFVLTAVVVETNLNTIGKLFVRQLPESRPLPQEPAEVVADGSPAFGVPSTRAVPTDEFREAFEQIIAEFLVLLRLRRVTRGLPSLGQDVNLQTGFIAELFTREEYSTAEGLIIRNIVGD